MFIKIGAKNGFCGLEIGNKDQKQDPRGLIIDFSSIPQNRGGLP